MNIAIEDVSFKFKSKCSSCGTEEEKGHSVGGILFINGADILSLGSPVCGKCSEKLEYIGGVELMATSIRKPDTVDIKVCPEDILNLENCLSRLEATAHQNYEALEMFTIRAMIAQFECKIPCATCTAFIKYRDGAKYTQNCAAWHCHDGRCRHYNDSEQLIL